MEITNEERLFLRILYEYDLFFKNIKENHRSLIKRGYIRRLPKNKIRAAGYGRRVGVVGLTLTESAVTLVKGWFEL